MSYRPTILVIGGNGPGTCGGESFALTPSTREDNLALYFFDVFDDQNVRFDDVGVELDNPESARQEARRSLSDIAGDELLEDGERRSFLILVRDDRKTPIYTASLNFTGLCLGT